MNALQLIAGLFGAASVMAHLADSITTAHGYFDLGIKEVSMNPVKKLFLHSKATLIVLNPLPEVAYALAAVHWGTSAETCITFSAFNTVSAVYGIVTSVHNYKLNKAAEAAKAKK